MATLGAIAAKRGQAMKRISAASAVLQERLGITGVDLPTQGHDPMLVWAHQTTALADLLDQVVEATEPPAEFALGGNLMREYMSGETEATSSVMAGSYAGGSDWTAEDKPKRGRRKAN